MKFNRYLIAKTIGLVLFSLTLLVCILALGACAHSHEYTEEITKQATCNSVGEKTFTCSCGDSYTQAIDKLDHSFTKYAYDEYEHWFVCANEGCTAVDPETEKVSHEHTTLVSHTDSTCTVAGKDVYKCACGHEQTTTLAFAPHNFTKYAFDETHHWIVCANEGCTAVDPETEKVAHNHATTVSHTDSTCTLAGKDVYTCACGHKQITSLPLAPHDYTKQVVTSANHWTACSVCDAVDPDHPKTTHDYTVTEIVKTATCTEQGSEKVQCSVCEHESSRQTNPLGHDFENAVLGEHNSDGHYMLCARCNENVFTKHNSLSADLIGADAECPDGYNKAATCGKNGHQDKTCLVCNEVFHTIIPATGEHVTGNWVTTHGTEHWKVCEVCETELERGFHDKELQVTKQPTCTEAGRQSMVCKICGRVETQGTNIPKIDHDYNPTGNGVAATCFEKGSQEVKCSVCGDISSVEIPKLTHVWSEYKADEDGKHHTKICSLCKTEATGEHGYGEGKVIHTANTCGESTITRYTCTTCGYNDDRVKVKEHNYHQIEESFVQGNCSQHTEYDKECSYCGDIIHVVEPDYGAHDMVYFPKKDVTETEDGNKSYWQCNICGRYFSAQYNGTEYFAEDIFILAPKYIVLETLDQMADIIFTLEKDVPSYDVYELTAKVYDNTGSRLNLWDDVSTFDDCYIWMSPYADLTNIELGDVVTIKGHLISRSPDDYFDGAEIVAVQSNKNDRANFNMSVNDTNLGYVVARADSGSVFADNANSALGLKIGENVIFTCYGRQDGAVLKSIIINGKSYSTDANGQLKILVTGDVNAQFIYDTTNRMSVTIDNINTSVWDADPYKVNEYMTYEYDGNTNDMGRLYKNSTTRFVVENALITDVVIEFAEYKLDEIGGNNINVGSNRDNRHSVDYTINDNHKVVLNLGDGYAYVDYNAVASQARIVSFTFTYETHNTLASYSANV